MREWFKRKNEVRNISTDRKANRSPGEQARTEQDNLRYNAGVPNPGVLR